MKILFEEFINAVIIVGCGMEGIYYENY